MNPRDSENSPTKISSIAIPGLSLADKPKGLFRELRRVSNSSFGSRSLSTSSSSSSETISKRLPLSPSSISSETHLASLNLPLEFTKKYTLIEEIGSGGSSFVMSAKSSSKSSVAVKFIFHGRLPLSHLKLDREYGNIPIEAFLLKRLDHPNIIKLLDVYEDAKFYYIVMELFGDGLGLEEAVESDALSTSMQNLSSSRDLYELIESNPFFAEYRIRKIFKQVVEAIVYLHAHNIVHRDIKDENVVIDLQLNCKLIDFGAARYIPSHPRDYFDCFNGTPAYMPPECVRGEKHRGPEVDVWCLGILLYILSFSSKPFKNQADILVGSRHPQKYKRTRALHSLLDSLMDPEPKSRPLASTILSHPWFDPNFRHTLL